MASNGRLVQPSQDAYTSEEAYRSVQQVFGLLTGQGDWGAAVALTSYDNDSTYSATIQNQGTGGKHLNIPGVLQVNNAGIFGTDAEFANLTVDDDTILGVDNTDSLTVNATSDFLADASFEEDVTVGDDAADALTVNATSTFAAPVTVNAAFAATAAVALGNGDADIITVIGVTTFRNAASSATQLLVDAGNNRVVVGRSTPLGSDTTPALHVVGRLYVAPDSANDLALQVRRSSAATVGFSIGVTSTDDFVFKDDGGTETFRVGDTASVYQAIVTGDLNVTDDAVIAGDVTSGGNVYVTSGSAFVGDTSNATMTQGLTINQGAADDEIVAFKSSDVAHGVTTITETDTYGLLKKFTAAGGGLLVRGLNGAAATGIGLSATGTGEDTARATVSSGTVYINANKVSGTGAAALAADGNLVAVASAGLTRFIVDAEGDIHMDATSNINAWDDHDDVALLEAYRVVTAPGVEKNYRRRFSDDIAAHARVLAETGVLTLNDDGHHFVSTKGLNGLMIDALRQCYGEVRALRTQVLALTSTTQERDHG
jgi:hypothetical protein